MLRCQKKNDGIPKICRNDIDNRGKFVLNKSTNFVTGECPSYKENFTDTFFKFRDYLAKF